MEGALNDISEEMWQEVEVHEMNRVRDKNIISALAHLMMAESVLHGEIIDLGRAKRHVEFRWGNKQCGHAFMHARMANSEGDSKQNDERVRSKKHARDDVPVTRICRSQKKRTMDIRSD